MSHGRRNFVEIFDKFPEECGHLIAELGRVYKNDATTKSLDLGPDDRLVYHQTHSQPVMEELFKWSHQLFELKLAEPNSGLGCVFQSFRSLNPDSRSPIPPLPISAARLRDAPFFVFDSVLRN
jgi:hypothetical protein